MDKADCEVARRQIKLIAEKVWEMRRPPLGGRGEPEEAYANVIIAYRKLEDASMRLGKAIQALDGGTSVYDKDQVPASGV